MNNGYQTILKRDEPDIFWNLFNLLKMQYKYIGARYDSLVIDYYFLRATESDYSILDYSCILTFDGNPYSCFLGALFSKDDKNELSLFEIPCLAMDSLNLSVSMKKQINLYFEKLYMINFDLFKVKGPDFYNNYPVICENLLKLGANIKNSFNRTIDLTNKLIDLKKGIRKSYHSLINWGLKELYIEIYDNKNISWKVLESFRKLHIEESKRETRSIRTWERQYDAIKEKSAFCITAKLENNLVSAAYFICSNNISYYASSASQRSLFDKPLNHAIIWKAILESKNRNALLFDIGETYKYGNQNHLSKKEINIAYFKNGFGGHLTSNCFIEAFKSK